MNVNLKSAIAHELNNNKNIFLNHISFTLR